MGAAKYCSINKGEVAFLSPKVQLLTVGKFSKVDVSDWAEIKILDVSTSSSLGNKRNRMLVKIALPNLYTQTLR